MPTFPYARRGNAFTGIPTADQWRALTTITTLFFTHARDNPLMLAIDHTLDAYHRSDAVPFNEAVESPAAVATRKRILSLLLLDVARHCAMWLASKRGSSSSTRRTYVQNLQAEALVGVHRLGVSLRDVDANTMAQSLASVAARIRWSAARAGMKDVRGGGRGKVLHDEYWGEVNIGGANPNHVQGGQLSSRWANSNEKFVFDFNRTQDLGAHVKYVAAGDRWRYEIIFHEGKLYRRANADGRERGEALHSGNRGWIFVMDKEGRCYTSFGEHPDDLLFHHSSILAGQAVTFAGAIETTHGVLMGIDNASGHYKPGLPEVLRALFLLRTRHKVDLTNVALVYMAGVEQVGDDRIPIMRAYPSALRFLLSGGDCPQG